VQRGAVRTDQLRLGDDQDRSVVALIDQAAHRRVASHGAGEQERSPSTGDESEHRPDVIR